MLSALPSSERKWKRNKAASSRRQRYGDSCKLRATNTVIDLEDDSAHDAASDASVPLEQALEEIMDNENEDDEEDVFQHGNLT
jgi:hypothetical protein